MRGSSERRIVDLNELVRKGESITTHRQRLHYSVCRKRKGDGSLDVDMEVGHGGTWRKTDEVR